MASYSYYIAESFSEDPSLVDEYGNFMDDDFLDTVGGLQEIEQGRQAQEQGFVTPDFRSVITTGADLSREGYIRKTQDILGTINRFSGDARREQQELLTAAQTTTERARSLYDNLAKSLEELGARLQQQFEEQSERVRREEERSRLATQELEEARRRALTGEGMIRQTAPARALGIGEIMTSGKVARGGSQRTAASEFLRNPPLIGEYDG